MAEDGSKTVKVVIIVLCLAGAAAGLYFGVFASGGGPVLPEGSNEPMTPEEQGMGDMTEEEIEAVTSGA
ncbi:MAG: hypothetical protein AAF937_05555 [Planctomycetota bacterium]